VKKKHPRRLPDKKIMLILRKGGLPLRADKEMQRFAPLGQVPQPRKARSYRRSEGQRPPEAGPVPASGFGPRRAGEKHPAGPGQWPRPDSTGRAEDAPVFRPAIHAAGRFSAACQNADNTFNRLRDVLLAWGAR